MTDPQIVVRATGDFRRLNADMAKTESGFGRMGSRIKVGLATAAVAGTAALVSLGKSAVGAASESQQSLGATETVFGKYADTVIRRSKEAAEAVGLSANEYRELGNVTGAMLQNAGTPLRKVTDLTDRLTRRAADMAATYGGTTKDAIESVNSLLRGEADPIEKYGVSIKQADVNARLAAKGLDKLEGSAKKQAEQQARLELLFQQTSKAAGQFGRESDTIAGKGQRLGATVEDLQAKFGDLLIPALAEGADLASDHLVPALEDLVGWLEENKDEFAELGGTVKDTVIPPLRGAVDLAQTAASVFGDLPGPVKELAVQAGVAALVLPRLVGGVSTLTAGAGGLITNLRDAEKRTTAFAGAARNAAGVGGMLALVHGAQQSDDAIRTLSSTAGGALLGFSLAGPWGAAIGAGAGAMLGLSDGTHRAEVAARDSITTWQTYASTLSDVTGATTAATKSMIIQDLQQSGLLKKAGELGVSQSTLVNGILGQKKAHGDLTAAIEAEEAAIRDAAAAYEKRFPTAASRALSDEDEAIYKSITARRANIDAIKAEVGEVKKASAAERERILLLRNVPDAVITRVQTPGAVDSKRELAELAATYKLTPKQIQTIIKMNGIKASRDEVTALQRHLIETGNVKPGDGWRREFGLGLTGGKRDAARGQADINALLGKVGDKSPGIARGGFGQGMRGDLSALKSTAAGGGRDIGAALADGISVGIDARAAAAAARARAAVSQAIAAARVAGEIESPSKKTRYLGEMLGAGLALGMKRSEPQVRAAGRRLVNSMVRDGREGISKLLGDTSTFVREGVDLKNDKRERARERRILKSLRDEYAALRRNATAQETVNKRLETARENLKRLREEYRDYAQAIKDTITATGDITQLGRQDDGTVTIKGLIDDLAQKVIGAERFDALIQKLAGQGLSRESIQQMLNAGPEAALATAEAIEFGGAAAIKQINALQARLAASGTSLGGAMAQRYYGAGVDAAKGIVLGLESQARQLDRAAVRLANELVRAVKKALGIKSPSREFMGIGAEVVKGLRIGLDDTYVKRSGELLAESLVKGFANPQLSADVLAGDAGSRTARVQVELTAEQLSAAQRGKAILLDIDAARSAGARSSAVTGG